MYKLKKLILWPYDQTQSKREIEFYLGEINIIHGASKTGKTALISCVDYALGSSHCKIPVGKILNSVKWFGVLLKNDNEEILLARISPNEKSKEGTIYLDCGNSVTIPEIIENGNNNVSNAKDIINEKMNYYNEKMEIDDASRYNTKPSYRDSISFNFQPQTIIASPDILFYKTNLTEYRERLKREFHYFLGVYDNETLINKIIKKNLEKERNRLQKIKEETENIKNLFINDLYVLYANAVDLGLVNGNIPVDDTEEIIIELNRIVKKQDVYIDYNENVIKQLDYKIMLLKKERDEKRIEILKYRKFIQVAKQSIDSANAHNFDKNYEERIGLFKWFSNQLIKDGDVISSFLNENVEYQAVIQSIMKYETSLVKNKNAITNLKEEVSQVELKLSKAIDEYNILNKQLKELYENNAKARSIQQLERKKFEFIGELKYKIEKYNSDESDEIQNRLNEIQVHLTKINNKIDKTIIDQRFNKISQKISDDTLEILKTLDVDDKYSPINIEIDDLTISRSSDQFGNNKEYLYQIGSASNWLSYHLSVHLALHKHFASLNPCRIMNFIIFDQPSQVYFPDGNIEEIKNKELESVKNIFKTLSMFNKKTKDIQIIVLEHAGRNIWGRYDNIKEIENWSDDLKLIPENWKEKD